MLPIWLNFLLTVTSYLLMLSLGLLLLNLKIRFNHLVFIAIFTAIINVCLEYGFTNPLIKTIIPIFILSLLYSYLSKINMYKSATAIIMGANIYYCIESIAMIVLHNVFNIFAEVYLNSILVNTFVVLSIVIIGLAIIALIKIFNWKMYNLAQMADNSKENKIILTALLLFMGIPFLIYCFIIWLTLYSVGLPVANTELILNIANIFFLIYFFATCFSLRRAEYALEKIFKDKANHSVAALLHQFFETHFQEEEHTVLRLIKDNVKSKKPVDNILIPQLHLFYQTQYALAQKKKVDFILNVSDLFGLEAYVDDAFIRMLKSLYENAFEAVESAEFKEIYSEITKDDDGFTFIIKNNGDILPRGHKNQPFKMGYTTKNAPDRGYGLYKVKKLIAYYQGSIDLRGSDGYTQATIKLPFKEGYTLIQAEESKKPVLMVINNEKGGLLR